VSIGQFYSFAVEHQGYQQAEYWLPEDFKLLQSRKQELPATWSRQAGGSVYVHTPHSTRLWAEVAHLPVFVSLAEARAYCKWAGGDIMSETEYERAVQHSQHDSRLKQLDSGGWEWTSTAFAPFEGFQAMSEYPEYSTDFFDGKHYVLKGSSPCTDPAMIRPSFRNFYQAQYPYVFAKFRLAHRE
jgi:formylglycine-generating enzyme required for sulfatase activity